MTDIQQVEEKITEVTTGANLPNGNTNIEQEHDDAVADNKAALNRSASCASILQGNGINKIKNLSRRVSFPTDDKLISGYNEPRNPWEHAHETTTEDLIQAYTQACQSWNVKPITKLLLQLQEIKDFTVRANSLTLKGEKLETRVVETLESIFKRVQFITIDLEATNLDEEAAASLFDMIEYYESAVNVLVGFNKNLGNRGWQAAAHMMRKMSCLRLFDGHSVPLSILAAPFVGRALRLSNTLVTLHLENAYLTSRPLLLIVAALKMNTTLKELFLADNELGAMDALQIANLLKFNRILQLLDLRNNPIQDIGLSHLSAGLTAQSSSSGLNGPIGGLQTLVLWNNQITQEGMTKLAVALRHTVSLATLNLGQNSIGDDGMLRLKEGLLQNHSLLRLGLVGTKLTDEGAVAVAEYLAESPRIIRLDIRNNDIKVAGLMALSLAFKINNSLLRLDIDKPNKRDSLKELAMKQESLMADIVTYAARNKEAAMAKVQAAAARQEEEARRAAEQEQAGLRYMDMTNTATPSSVNQSGEVCSNNSNNQPTAEHHPPQKIKGASTVATVTRDVDDTPEDSPEFLPRSSVPYHQVAPVMLSNSELAKRAAAAKSNRLQEDKTATGRFQIKPVSTNPIDTITSTLSQPQPQDTSSESIANSKPCDAGDHSDSAVAMATQTSAGLTLKGASAGDRAEAELQQNSGEPTENTLSSSLQTKDTSSFYGSKAKGCESEKRRDNLEIFAEQLTNTVLRKNNLTASALDRDFTNCQDTVQSTNVKTPHEDQKQPVSSEDQQPNDVDSIQSDPASLEIQNLVALATESATSGEGAREHTSHTESSIAAGEEIQNPVAMETYAQSSNENASQLESYSNNLQDTDGSVIEIDESASSSSTADQDHISSSAVSPKPDATGIFENAGGVTDRPSQEAVHFNEPPSLGSTFNPNSDSTKAKSVFQDTDALQEQSHEPDIANPEDEGKQQAVETYSMITLGTKYDDKQENFEDSSIETGSPESAEEQNRDMQCENDSAENSSNEINKVNITEGADTENFNMTQHPESADLTTSTNVISDNGKVTQNEEDVRQDSTVTYSLETPSDELESHRNLETLQEDIGDDKADQNTQISVVANDPGTAAEIPISPPSQIEKCAAQHQDMQDDVQISVSESGFDTTTDDYSLLSCDLSPTYGDQTLLEPPQETADLLTPDSGVVNFITKDKRTGEHTYHHHAVTDNHASDEKYSKLKLEDLDDHSSVNSDGLEISKTNDS